MKWKWGPGCPSRFALQLLWFFPHGSPHPPGPPTPLPPMPPQGLSLSAMALTLRTSVGCGGGGGACCRTPHGSGPWSRTVVPKVRGPPDLPRRGRGSRSDWPVSRRSVQAPGRTHDAWEWSVDCWGPLPPPFPLRGQRRATVSCGTAHPCATHSLHRRPGPRAALPWAWRPTLKTQERHPPTELT